MKKKTYEFSLGSERDLRCRCCRPSTVSVVTFSRVICYTYYDPYKEEIYGSPSGVSVPVIQTTFSDQTCKCDCRGRGVIEYLTKIYRYRSFTSHRVKSESESKVSTYGEEYEEKGNRVVDKGKKTESCYLSLKFTQKSEINFRIKM